jgi:hypothetical protein
MAGGGRLGVAAMRDRERVGGLRRRDGHRPQRRRPCRATRCIGSRTVRPATPIVGSDRHRRCERGAHMVRRAPDRALVRRRTPRPRRRRRSAEAARRDTRRLPRRRPPPRRAAAGDRPRPRGRAGLDHGRRPGARDARRVQEGSTRARARSAGPPPRRQRRAPGHPGARAQGPPASAPVAARGERTARARGRSRSAPTAGTRSSSRTGTRPIYTRSTSNATKPRRNASPRAAGSSGTGRTRSGGSRQTATPSRTATAGTSGSYRRAAASRGSSSQAALRVA